MAGKKSARQTMEEWLAKQQTMVADPQFQEDIVTGAQALPGKVAQGAMNAGNKLGNAMEKSQVVYPGAEKFAPELAMDVQNGIRGAGTALRQGIYDMRTGGEPAAPYPDAYGLMTDNANAINSNMKPPGMMPQPGQTGVMENQIISELQAMGAPITPEMIQKYMAYKAQMQQGLQGAGQAIQGAAGKGMDAMRGLLQ